MSPRSSPARRPARSPRPSRDQPAPSRGGTRRPAWRESTGARVRGCAPVSGPAAPCAYTASAPQMARESADEPHVSTERKAEARPPLLLLLQLLLGFPAFSARTALASPRRHRLALSQYEYALLPRHVAWLSLHNGLRLFKRSIVVVMHRGNVVIMEQGRRHVRITPRALARGAMRGLSTERGITNGNGDEDGNDGDGGAAARACRTCPCDAAPKRIRPRRMRTLPQPHIRHAAPRHRASVHVKLSRS